MLSEGLSFGLLMKIHIFQFSISSIALWSLYFYPSSHLCFKLENLSDYNLGINRLYCACFLVLFAKELLKEL